MKQRLWRFGHVRKKIGQSSNEGSLGTAGRRKEKPCKIEEKTNGVYT